jgi:hypothetical protein
MNLKISSSLLALGTFTSAILLSITPVSAQKGNGSNNGNGSNTTNAIQFLTATITANVLAAVNTALAQILAANPLALANATSGLVPAGASASLVAAAADLQQLVAGFGAGNVSVPQLNKAIAAYNTYVEALVASLGGADAVAFLSSSGADKALDSTNTPGVRGLLLALSARAKS